MPGAGFKTFNTGDVLTASDVNTYLMQQTVMVFASSAARSTALGANVSEGMISYLTDTNVVQVYNGSAWVAMDDADAIQNTIVDAKGDLITATAADTPARLAVGANGTVLTANSATATGLEWGTISAGGMTSIASGSLTGSSITLSSISGSYKNLQLVLRDLSTSGNNFLAIRINGDTTSNYASSGTQNDGGSNASIANFNDDQISLNTSSAITGSGVDNTFIVDFLDYTSSSFKVGRYVGLYGNPTPNFVLLNATWAHTAITAAITSITIRLGSGTFDNGTYILYGVS